VVGRHRLQRLESAGLGKVYIYSSAMKIPAILDTA
jgi:hypothetical protein